MRPVSVGLWAPAPACLSAARSPLCARVDRGPPAALGLAHGEQRRERLVVSRMQLWLHSVRRPEKYKRDYGNKTIIKTLMI